MSWKKVEVKTPIPEDVAGVITTASDVTSGLADFFASITALLEIAKAFSIATLDPFSLLVTALITELETLINDIFATGFYMITINPLEITNSQAFNGFCSNSMYKDGVTCVANGSIWTPGIVEQRKILNDEEEAAIKQYDSKYRQYDLELANAKNSTESNKAFEKLATLITSRDALEITFQNRRDIIEQERSNYGFDSIGVPILKPRDCINLAIDSLDDLGDSNRPIFSDAVEISAIGFMATSPGFDQFKKLLEDLIAVFAIPDWELALYRFNEIVPNTLPPSTIPDWSSVRLNSFAPMDQLQKQLIGFLETLKGFQLTSTGNLQDLIDIMTARTNQLEKISKDLDDLAKAITTATGVFVLNVPIGVGGVNRLKTELSDAFLECQNNNYTIMTLFVGGGPESAKAVDKLRGLFLS